MYLVPENEVEEAKRFLSSGSLHVHCVGVCGIGMAGLAFHLASRHLRVDGCDRALNSLAPWLERHGVGVVSGHDPAHLAGVDLVVRSTAIRPDHPEIAAAVESGIPVCRRGAVLAALLDGFYSVIVSGTHGKTTTASMIVQVMRACGSPPSYCIGAYSDVLDAAGSGRSGVMVVEADESDGTLDCYSPDIAVITNVEFDHSEFFKDMPAVTRCFEALAGRVRNRVIYCADDPGAAGVCSKLDGAFGYGFSDSADLRAHDPVVAGAYSSTFAVSLHGRRLGEVALPAGGRHNILNALAACSVALAGRESFAGVQEGLVAFKPARRRFERVIENDDLTVISDYSHHPSEIAALTATAGTLRRSRLLAVFQPHRFSRTRALGPDFPRAFKGVDELVLAPVYAASEEPVEGGSSWELYARFRKSGGMKVLCARSLCQAWDYLRGALGKGDVLLVVGAGDVVRIGEWARDELSGDRAGAHDKVAAWESGLKGLGLRATTVAARVPMAGKTTLQVGGKADIFAEVGCEHDLAVILEWTSRNDVPTRILGRGSNVLAGDLGFHGVVLRLGMDGFGRIGLDAGDRVVCGAAVMLNKLVERLAEHDKSGLVFLGGIPGTVGGALRMNAGAWGSSIGEHTEWVRVLNMEGASRILSRGDLKFAYRECESLRECVVVEAGFAVESGDGREIAEELGAIAKKRAWMKGLRSAGSVFRNPDNDAAGRLIERVGLKGLRIGGAMVSEVHGNMIVTEPGATASDVNALIEIIVMRVRANSGVELVKEIVCLE